MHAYRDYEYSAPDELGSGLFLLSGPPEPFVPAELQGTTVALVVVIWAGDIGDGAEAIAPLRAMEPRVDLVGPMAYTEFQCMIDDPPGRHNYWSAGYLDDLPDEALGAFMKYGFERPSPFTQPVLMPWGGAVARVGEDATSLTKRDAAWIMHPFAMWENPADSDKNIAWVTAFRRAIAPYASGGIYLNYISHEGDDRIRAALRREQMPPSRRHQG